MSRSTAAERTSGTTRWPIVAGLVVVTAAMIGALVHQSASSSAPSIREGVRRQHGATTEADAAVPAAGGVVAEADGAVTEADGLLPEGVTVFDDGYPGVANLHPDLRQALREATTDAAGEGVELYINSGWRSTEYQSQLHRQAVSEFGSEEEAARWVATADTSAHVSGNAVDIARSDVWAWLSEHGAAYGLCQVYTNEPWHYELRPKAIDRGCPPMGGGRPHGPRPPRLER